MYACEQVHGLTGRLVGVVMGIGQWACGSHNNILAWLVDTKYAYRRMML